METNVVRYAKIALQLPNKTVRDVALRCRWMTKKENSKRRKEDNLMRKSKDKKERHSDPFAKTSNFMVTCPNVTPFATPMMPLDSDESISYDGEVLYFTKPLRIPNSFGNIFLTFSYLQLYLLSILFQVAVFLINGEILTAYDVFIMKVQVVKYVLVKFILEGGFKRKNFSREKLLFLMAFSLSFMNVTPFSFFFFAPHIWFPQNIFYFVFCTYI
ncbi:hypothetical protein OIU78_025624 [Salix suchowensis]|nr:hypothetical protein OIU78_025624 [Salix suchowensis]